MEDRKTPQMHKYGESKTTWIMMATVCQVTSRMGRTKFQAVWILLNIMYNAAKSHQPTKYQCPTNKKVWNLFEVPSYDEASIQFWTQV